MSQSPKPDPADRAKANREEANKAIRFLLVKAAIFILIPLVASIIAVWFTLKPR